MTSGKVGLFERYIWDRLFNVTSGTWSRNERHIWDNVQAQVQKLTSGKKSGIDTHIWVLPKKLKKLSFTDAFVPTRVFFNREKKLIDLLSLSLILSFSVMIVLLYKNIL